MTVSVTMQRVLNTAPYESLRFEVTFDDTELVGKFTAPEVAARLHIMAYAQILSFEVIHNFRTMASALAELKKVRSSLESPGTP